MAKTLELIAHVDDFKDVYRNKTTGIAFVYDASSGCRYSCHSNIDATGSIRGMKSNGYWKKNDRCIRSNGCIYNIDTMIKSDYFEMVAANYCMCESCLERKMPEEYIKKEGD